jgi:hypothetical protein
VPVILQGFLLYSIPAGSCTSLCLVCITISEEEGREDQAARFGTDREPRDRASSRTAPGCERLAFTKPLHHPPGYLRRTWLGERTGWWLGYGRHFSLLCLALLASGRLTWQSVTKLIHFPLKLLLTYKNLIDFYN